MIRPHEVVATGETSATCRCGEVFHAATYQLARLDHVRHAFEYRHDPIVEEEEIPF